jgi:hypothetical protein
MWKPTGRESREGRREVGKTDDVGTHSFHRGKGEGMYVNGGVRNTGSPSGWLVSRAGQRVCREAQTRPLGVADGVVVPLKSGNADGGKHPWSESSAEQSKR